MTHSKRWMVGVVVLCGLVFRWWLFARSGWRIEYDEAMVGLMAADILDGARPVFLAAQPTLGMLEGYILAGLYTLFGVNTFALRMLSLLYSAGYIAGVAWLGWLAYGRRVGVLAGLIAAVSSAYLVAVGTKVWAGTMGTLAFGTLLVCIAATIPRRDTSPRWRGVLWALLGIVGGLAFWTAFLSAYYLVPVALVLLVWLLVNRDARQWLGVLVAAVSFFIGSAPFWVYNATHNWLTLQLTLSSESSTPDQLWQITVHLMTDIVPRLAVGSAEWGGVGTVWRGVLVTVYLCGLVALAISAVRRRTVARWLVLGVALSVPVIYINSGFARNALNPFGVDATGRYLVMWHSVWPIGVAALAVWLAQWRRVVGAGLVAFVVGFNLLNAFALDAVRLFDSPYYLGRLPDDLSPLIAELDALDVRYVWTDVGLAHPLIFYSGERIIAADYYDTVISGGLLRFPEYFETVTAATARGERVAYVAPVPAWLENPPIERALAAADVAYSAIRVGDLVIYLPDDTLPPEAIAPGLGFQY